MEGVGDEGRRESEREETRIGEDRILGRWSESGMGKLDTERWEGREGNEIR